MPLGQHGWNMMEYQYDDSSCIKRKPHNDSLYDYQRRTAAEQTIAGKNEMFGQET